MATLRQYFDTDFPNVMKASSELVVSSTLHGNVKVIANIHRDFDSNTKYLSCYIPSSERPLDICVAILKQINEVLVTTDNVKISIYLPGEEPRTSDELVFSGRVFFYSETDIPQPELDSLKSEARANGISMQLRGNEFAEKRAEIEHPFAFICHDSRDKDEVARPIARQLSKLMCPVWYDEFSMNVGDNLRDSIEKGIKECGKCILILTPNFFSNKGWTKTEFDSIFTRQILQKANFVLPIWHGVNKEEVYEYSPSLANTLGVSWTLGTEEVCRRLHRAITAKPQDKAT